LLDQLQSQVRPRPLHSVVDPKTSTLFLVDRLAHRFLFCSLEVKQLF
jgi:hypothetical protein